jgi:hypothetical protein
MTPHDNLGNWIEKALANRIHSPGSQQMRAANPAAVQSVTLP